MKSPLRLQFMRLESCWHPMVEKCAIRSAQNSTLLTRSTIAVKLTHTRIPVEVDSSILSQVIRESQLLTKTDICSKILPARTVFWAAPFYSHRLTQMTPQQLLDAVQSFRTSFPLPTNPRHTLTTMVLTNTRPTSIKPLHPLTLPAATTATLAMEVMEAMASNSPLSAEILYSKTVLAALTEHSLMNLLNYKFNTVFITGI